MSADSTLLSLMRAQPEHHMHYALSEEGQLQLRNIRDGLRAIANLARGNGGDLPIPETVAGDDLGSVLDIFALAAGFIVESCPLVRPTGKVN